MRSEYLDNEPPGWPPIIGPAVFEVHYRADLRWRVAEALEREQAADSERSGAQTPEEHAAELERVYAARVQHEEAELQRTLAETLERRKQAGAHIAAALSIPAESLTRDQIDRAHLCEQWVTDYTRENCALALLTTDPRPLPDHVCWQVHDATADAWQERHGRQEGDTLYLPVWPIEWEEQQALMLCVERHTPAGAVTLFGLVRQTSEKPRVLIKGQKPQRVQVFEGEPPSARAYPWEWDDPALIPDLTDAPSALRPALERLETWYRQTLYGRPTRPGPKLGSAHSPPTEAEQQAYKKNCRPGRGPTTIANLMGGDVGYEVSEQQVWYWQSRGWVQRPSGAPRRNRKKPLNQ